MFILAPTPSKIAEPDAKVASVALIGAPATEVCPLPAALRLEMFAEVLPGVVPSPTELVTLAADGTKFEVDVTVIPGENCVDRDAPNEVLEPKVRFDLEPVCRDMLIV